jgi:hypothetical protein
MNRKKLITITIVGALGAVALFGAFAYGTARVAKTVLAAPSQNVPMLNASKGIGDGGTQEDLANALGITVDELTAARQKANEAAIDQALADGLITQAQADQLKTKENAFPFAGRWDGWLSQNGIDYEALLADALGITPEKLQEAKNQAFQANIDQAVTDGKLTQEQADLMKGQQALYSNDAFRTAMQSAFETAVKAAVSSGVITQAQADAILQNAGNGFGGMRGFEGPGGPGGFGPDFGGHGPGGRQGGMDEFQPQAPSATPSDGGL